MAGSAVTALIVGTILALAALVYVLWPLIAAAERHPSQSPSLPPSTAAGDEVRLRAMQALQEIEFDHATGKLSDADYTALKARYVSEVAAAEESDDALAEDRAEVEIRRARAQQRVCAVCGPRPEPGARYCSRCGALLV